MRHMNWRSLFVPKLHPVYDRYRIVLLRVLLVVVLPLLATEIVAAFYLGEMLIGYVELATLALVAVFFKTLWKQTHLAGNVFIVFSTLISVTAVVVALESPAILLFFLALPTFYIYFLGLRKGLAVIFILVVVLCVSTVSFYLGNGHLPWPQENLIFAVLVFIYITVFTAAFERTNKHLLAGVREKAEKDELTKVSTRRTFMELLEYELKRVRRTQGTFSLVLWDVDHFKRINDTHGHLVGDEVLRAITETCVASLRGSDIVGRVGGEEFACLLPDTGKEAAVHVAEKIRQAIARPRPDTPCCSISLGVAEYSPGDTPETLFQRADQALYAAKAAGRDCVMSG